MDGGGERGVYRWRGSERKRKRRGRERGEGHREDIEMEGEREMSNPEDNRCVYSNQPTGGGVEYQRYCNNTSPVARWINDNNN